MAQPRKPKKNKRRDAKSTQLGAGTELKRILMNKSVANRKKGASKNKPASLLDRLSSIVGKIKGLPADMSVNHDHYLYGVPKREK